MAEKQLDQELTQTEQRQSRLKELIAKGKEQGYLTYAEVNDHLPEEIADPDQVEDIIRMIGDMGISVGEEAPDDDQLILGENSAATDDSAAEEAAAALAAVENDVGRTTDPVRMYMREMGTVELLTREGEIIIAKRIEEGIREVMQAMAYYPGIVDTVLAVYDRIQTEEGRMSDLLAGFLDLDPEDETPIEAASTEEVSDQNFDDSDSSNDDNDSNEDDAEEGDTGPDPEEVRTRFEALRANLAKAQKVIGKKVVIRMKAKTHSMQLAKSSRHSNSLQDCLTNFASNSGQYSIRSAIKNGKSFVYARNKESLIARSSLKNGMETKPILNGFLMSPRRRNQKNWKQLFRTCSVAKRAFSLSPKVSE